MRLTYTFKDETILKLALTQRGANCYHNNERLEFVGDRVLGLSVATMLYEMFPTEKEGELARRLSVLVSTETLADVALFLGVDKELKHGHLTAGRQRHTLANAMEAVLGAIFFDGGFDAARKFVYSIWHSLAAAEIRAPKDVKTELQELVQQRTGGSLPKYEYGEQVGEAHCPVFTVTVSAMGYTGTGSGPSKKTAGSAAAEDLLKKLMALRPDDNGRLDDGADAGDVAQDAEPAETAEEK